MVHPRYSSHWPYKAARIHDSNTRFKAMTEAADNPQQAKDADPQRPETEEAVSFGFEQVSPEEKTRRVGSVFAAVADRYDLMNDLMSLGTHRLFKRMVLQMAGVREGHHILDLAGGTGDMAALFAPAVGAQGRVVLTDLETGP